MKIKCDHITNSSSTSFILYIESDVESLDCFKELLNNYIKEIDGELAAGSDYSNPIVEKVSSNTYKVEEWAAMYNGYDDIPSYMVNIMISSHMGSFHTYSKFPDFIKGIKFDIHSD